MTDSGFSQLPPGSRISDRQPVQARPLQTAKIEEIRGELRDVSRTVRLEGEVTRVDPNGLVTIRTDQGDEIDLRLRGGMPLQEGQRVEIELPPGHPPRQVTVRPAATPPLPEPVSPPQLSTDAPLSGR